MFEFFYKVIILKRDWNTIIYTSKKPYFSHWSLGKCSKSKKNIKRGQYFTQKHDNVFSSRKCNAMLILN